MPFIFLRHFRLNSPPPRPDEYFENRIPNAQENLCKCSCGVHNCCSLKNNWHVLANVRKTLYKIPWIIVQTDWLTDLPNSSVMCTPSHMSACSLFSFRLATEATDEHSWNLIGFKLRTIRWEKAVCWPAGRACYFKFSHPWCKVNDKFVSGIDWLHVWIVKFLFRNCHYLGTAWRRRCPAL